MRLRKKRKYSTFLKLIVIVLIGTAFTILIGIVPKIVIIKEISCENQFGPCHSSINKQLELFMQKNYKQSKQALVEMLDNNSLVEKYSVQFRLPNKLQINILEKKAVFSITKKDTMQFALVDVNGQVLEIQDNSNLPMLVVEENFPSTGTYISDEFLFALNIIYDLNTSYQLEFGTLVNRSLVVDLTGKTRVIFPLEGDKDVLIGGLNAILSDLSKEKSELANEDNICATSCVIDLRFKNPVLKNKV